jgi:hypothetical protein
VARLIRQRRSPAALSIPWSLVRRSDRRGRSIIDIDPRLEERQMANRIVHAEVVGKDGPGLQDFYGKLFDWRQNTDLAGWLRHDGP